MICTDVAQATAAANRIWNMRPRDKAPSRAVPLNLDDVEGNEKGHQGVKIELKNISFKYPTRDVPVLNGLNMTVRASTTYSSWMLTSSRLRKANLLPLSALLVIVISDPSKFQVC